MAVERSERSGGLARASLVLALGGLGLAACATAPGRLSTPSTTAGAPAQGAPLAPGGGQGLHGTDKPYQINGIWYYPHAEPNYDVTGFASWYGPTFHNKHTADGEIFDQYALTAAHKTLPLPSIVEVTNLDNGRSVRLRLNDRGPFVDGRVLDVSRGAAEQLGFARQGLTRVRVRYVGPAPAFFTPVMYASTDPALTGNHHAGASAPGPASDTRLQTISKEPAGRVDQQALTPVAMPPIAMPPVAMPPVAAPPAQTSPQPVALASNDGSRFTEPLVDLSPGALAPVTSPAAAPAIQPPTPSPIVQPALSPPPPPLAPPSANFLVQAGAFSNRSNAERAAAQLGADAAIRPMDRGGLTLYRVVLAGYADIGAAQVARARAIAAGFADARVIAAY